MNEKKNLDRLFQEKFKDFEVAPPEFVWDNIQEILQEKKKRRVIPIWFKLSGVAALLVLGGFLATLFFNNNENPAVNAPAVVIDNNATATPADAVKASPVAAPAQSVPSAAGTNNASQDDQYNITNINSAVASGNENTAATKNNNTATGGSAITTNSSKPSVTNNHNNAVVYENTKTNSSNKNNAKRDKNTITASAQQSDALADSQSTVKNQQNNTVANPAATITAPNNNIINTTKTEDVLAAAKLRSGAKNYANNPNAQNNAVNKSNVTAEKSEGIATAENNSNRNVAENNTNIINTVSPDQSIATNDSGISKNKNQANANAATSNNTNVNTSVDNNITTIIDKTIPVSEAVAQTAIDTTKALPENKLEKRLQEILKGNKEEDKPLAETNHKDRWNIKPQVAPVFYNSLSNGSPINEQFASNSKSYDNELSVGLGINYALNDRITIRSGVNSVNLSYATNGIAFYASLNGMTNNIGVSKATGNIVVQNPGDVPSDPLLINGEANQLSTGSMIQKTGYIEVPMELSYAVVNNQFGIDVIGGVSTLFLNQNNVSVVSSTGLSTKVGEAQNLNDVHFSTNIGLGFKYRFWDSFQANFEPMFKYQVNAYSRDAGNFKPYFIGLYTGVSFSF